MLERLLLLGFGFFLCVPLSIVALKMGLRLSLLDRPGAIKPHAKATPYTGGAAMLFVILVGGFMLAIPISILIGAVIAWLIGFADDFRRLPAALKFVTSGLPLAVAAVGLGVHPPLAIGLIGAGMILVNAFNVIDGLDGLAGGVAALTLLPVVVGATAFSNFAAVVLGAVAGFLVLNLPPARLFMGDEGSLLLGYILWVLAMALLVTRPLPLGLAFAFLIWVFPIINALYVLVRRARERRPLWVGDRGHLYDALNRRFGLRTCIAICWGIAATGSTMAVALQ